MLTIPLMYEDAEVVVLPGDDHNPPLPIRVSERLLLEPTSEQLVRVTFPEGRKWAKLPIEMFSEKYLKLLGLSG